MVPEHKGALLDPYAFTVKTPAFTGAVLRSEMIQQELVIQGTIGRIALKFHMRMLQLQAVQTDLSIEKVERADTPFYSSSIEKGILPEVFDQDPFEGYGPEPLDVHLF